MKNRFLKWFLPVLWEGALLCIVLTGCGNYLRGQEIRNELEERIAYANAPSYNIKIDYPLNTGLIRSPAGGEISKKVTDTFSLAFEVAGDYEFLSWTIIDAATNKEISKDKYLMLEAYDQASTSCTFVKEPESGMQLCLLANVAKRPRIIDETPKNDPAGTFRDARIVVMFDQTIDQNSIYYTDNEISQIKKEEKIKDTDFFPRSSTSKKCGYEKDGENYFKNIQIINYNTGESLLKYYDSPFFEDPRTLVIPSNIDNPPPGGSQVLVTISKNFYFEKDKKTVKLREDKVWTYYTNSSRDTLGPDVVNKNIMAKNPASDALMDLSGNSGTPTSLYQSKLFFNIKVTDPGSGPCGYFYLNLESTTNPALSGSLKIPYTELASKDAYYNAKEGNNIVPAEYNLPSVFADGKALSDGNYKLTSFVFEDRNARKTTSQIGKYIKIDMTAPVISSFGINTISDSQDLKLDFVLSGDQNDLSYALIKIKEKNSDQNWDSIPGIKYTASDSTNKITEDSSTGIKSCRIKNLDYGKTYVIRTEFADMAGNITSKEKEVKTRPATPENFRKDGDIGYSSAGKKAKVTLKWDSPSGNYDGYELTVTKMNPDATGVSSQVFELGKTGTTYTFNDLDLIKTYQFKIRSYNRINSNKKDYSDYSSLEIKTPPEQAVISKCELNANYSSVCIAWSLPGSVPYIDDNSSTKDAKIYLYYGLTEEAVKAEPAGQKVILSFTKHTSGFYSVYFTPDNVIIDVANLNIGKYYYFAIKTIIPDSSDNDYSSSWSEVKSLFIPAKYAAPKFTNLGEPRQNKYVTDTSARLIWTAPSGVTGSYQINIYCNGQFKTSVQSTASPNNECTISNLAPDTEYTFTARTQCGELESVLSSSLTMKTDKAAYEGLNLHTESNDNGKLVLKWNSLTDVTIGGKTIKRIDIRYILVDDNAASWRHVNNGGLSDNGPTYNNQSWDGGWPVTKTSYTPPTGKRIIKIDLYGIDNNRELLLSTNTIQETFP
ncbi:MAG: fibronectin type III domain-containing protein [Treponema sp.]|nr:fibronectin type III domain-containing protein [Treponema sp.]